MMRRTEPGRLAARFGMALSPREKSVLELLAVGNNGKEIARALGLSPRTVEIYVAKMRIKLGALTAAHAVDIGYRTGILGGVGDAKNAKLAG